MIVQRAALLLLALLQMFLVSPAVAEGEDASLTVTALYRERIALPPGAVLDVSLLDVSRQDIAASTLSSQRFLMDAVPMTVRLHYDPRLIDAAGDYVVSAILWSGDEPVFRTVGQHPVLDGSEQGQVQVMLEMVRDADGGASTPQAIAGIAWAVTEIGGHTARADDPAMLMIDDDARFSLYGGCNRFAGQLELSDTGVRFPEQFAGTLMACPDDRENEERDILAALALVRGHLRDGKTLDLSDASGKVLIRLSEQPE